MPRIARLRTRAKPRDRRKGKGSGKGSGKASRKGSRKSDREKYVAHLSDGFKARDERTIWCGKLGPADIQSKEELAEVFQRFGTVAHVHIQADRKFAFLHFEDADAARAAVESESVLIRGHPVQVKVAAKHRGEEADGADLGDEAGSDPEADIGADEAEMDDHVDDALEDIAETRGHTYSDGVNGANEEELIEAEGNIQALRVAVIHSLEDAAKPVLLHELGADKFIQEHKHKLPSLSFIEFIRSFPDNFDAEDHGNGRFMITLLSADYEDIDPTTVEHLAGKASSAKARGKSKTDKAVEEKIRRVERKMRFANKNKERLRSRRAPADAKTVTAGLLSDGWKPRTDHTVWIGNLPATVRTKHDVANCFQAQFGPVNHIHVTDDLGWGFVHFDHLHDVHRALDVGFVDMFGKRVEVKRADGKGDGKGGNSSVIGSSGRRRDIDQKMPWDASNGIRVPELPHRSAPRSAPRSGHPPPPPPAVVPQRSEVYRRDPMPPPPQYAERRRFHGSDSYYSDLPPPRSFDRPPHQYPGRPERMTRPPPPAQPRFQRPAPDSSQRRPAIGAPSKPLSALPSSTSRAAPRPSMAPHLEGRDGAKRRRLA